VRQMGALAYQQLQAWEVIARDWLLIPKVREPDTEVSLTFRDLHLVCWKCDVSVYHVGAQSVSPGILQSSTVAHLRTMHRELDPDA
jgi:hypothetical protein